MEYKSDRIRLEETEASYRKKWKEQAISVRFMSRFTDLVLKKNEERVRATKSYGYLIKLEISRGASNELINEVLNYFEEITVKNNETVVISDRDLTHRGYFDFGNQWLKIRHPSQEHIAMREMIAAIKQYKIKCPTVTFRVIADGTLENQIYYIQYYLAGHQGEIHYHIQNDRIVVKETKKNLEYKGSMQAIRQMVQELLDKVQNTMRLKNVYDPPSKYFDLFLKQRLGVTSIEIKKKLFKHLLTYQTVEEIENTCAKLYEEKVSYWVTTRNVCLWREGNNYVVICEHDIYIYPKDEGKQAKQKFEELIVYNLLGKEKNAIMNELIPNNKEG